MITLLLAGSLVSTDVSATGRQRCSLSDVLKAAVIAMLLFASGNSGNAAGETGLKKPGADQDDYGSSNIEYASPYDVVSKAARSSYDPNTDRRITGAPEHVRAVCLTPGATIMHERDVINGKRIETVTCITNDAEVFYEVSYSELVKNAKPVKSVKKEGWFSGWF